MADRRQARFAPLFWLVAAVIIAAPVWRIAPWDARGRSDFTADLVVMCVSICVIGIVVGTVSFGRGAGQSGSTLLPRLRSAVIASAIGALFGAIVAGVMAWLAYPGPAGLDAAEAVTMLALGGSAAGGGIAFLFGTGIGQN